MPLYPDLNPFDTFLQPFHRVLSLFRSFDAEHFNYIIQHGYNYEKNHAFFPGYPMYITSLMVTIPKHYIVIVDFVYRLLMGASSSVMIYYVGKWVKSNNFFSIETNNLEEGKTTKYEKQADMIAFGAAMLYNVN